MTSPCKTPTSTKKRAKIASTSAKKRKQQRTADGVPINMRKLNHVETGYVAKYLATCLQNNKEPSKSLTLYCSEGKPTITISSYAYDEKAPFRIVLKEGGHAYIPFGDEPDSFLFHEAVKIIIENRYDTNDEGLIGLVCVALSSRRYCIIDLENRVRSVLQRATFFSAMAVVSLQGYVESNKKDMQHLRSVIDGIQTAFGDVKKQTDQALSTAKTANERSMASNNKADEALSTAKTADGKADEALSLVKRLESKSNAPSGLYYYSKNSTVNQDLRGVNPHAVAIQEARVISDNLNSLPRQAGTCFRGIDINSLDSEYRATLEKTILSKGCFLDAGFLSCSRSSHVAWHFAHELAVKRGTNPCPLVMQIEHVTGRLIMDHVHPDYHWEEEVLFKPNTPFEILDCKRDKRGTLWVHMKELY